jgi:small subunit ribosomal protein S6
VAVAVVLAHPAGRLRRGGGRVEGGERAPIVCGGRLATMGGRMADPLTYDLTLLLDTSFEEDQRTRILADVETMIQDRGGELVAAHDWGRRDLAFEVRKKADAEYHLIQFRGGRELLERLDRTLRITDGVVRYRIIKLRPGTPEVPDLRSVPAGATAGSGSDEG